MSQQSVVYFDFLGTLFQRREGRYAPREATEALLALGERHRLGILCNLPRGLSREDLRTQLRAAGLEASFDPALLVVASDLPCPLPDRRAFAAAAALAEAPPERILYITADPLLAAEARLAGFQVQAPPPLPSPAPRARDEAVPLLGVEPMLRLGEVDEDTGPVFVLQGRVVTMNDGDEVIAQGRLAIRGGKLAAVLAPGQPLPPGFEGAPVIDTRATLYPGLIDLHNHFAYNVLPLWLVPSTYKNRGQWPRHPQYHSNVSLPLRALAGASATARAIVRYVEAKALIGGTCTGQGIKTQVSGGIRLFRGAMRNVEQTDDTRLPEANTMVPDLRPVSAEVDKFRRNLARYTSYFYHLSEGIDASARQHFVDLQAHDLLAKSLVGVHALALEAPDYEALARAGAKIIWSPFSNLLLYGQTLPLREVLDAGLPFSLGCDWSPTGSKNLLEELKVARWVVETQGVSLDARALVQLVTREPARSLGWDRVLGMLAPGCLADVVAIAGTDGDPYSHLVEATEADVALVVVHGVARHGTEPLMRQLRVSPGAPLEVIDVAGQPKAFYFETQGSDLNGLGLGAAVTALKDAMGDLPAFVDAQRRGGLGPRGAFEPPAFALALDMEVEEESTREGPGGLLVPQMLSDTTGIAASIPLDTPTVDAAHLEAVRQQRNLVDALKDALLQAYG